MPTKLRPAVSVGEARTHWVLVELRNLLNPILGAAISVLVTLWTVLPEDQRWPLQENPLALTAGALAVLWIVGYLTFLRPRYSELAQQKSVAEKDLADAQGALQSALDSLLMQLLKDRSAHTPSCRLSAYSVERDRFVLLSRSSVNPVHERRGRPTYPLDTGVIGEAWAREGAHQRFDVDTREEWEAELVSSGNFTAEDARGLKMFSKSVIAVRVDTPSGEKVGMLVLESEDKDQFAPSAVDALRKRPLTAAITSLISGWHEHFPRAKEWHHELENGKPKAYLSEPAWKNSGQ